jgi:hypothetical protein
MLMNFSFEFPGLKRPEKLSDKHAAIQKQLTDDTTRLRLVIDEMFATGK